VAYFGHSGHLLLPPISHVITVRVLAPLEFRIARLMVRDRFSAQTAREYIRKVDEERSRWMRFVYGRNVRDVEQFDLCINLDRLSCSAACALLLAAGQQAEYQPTEASLGALENLYLSTQVLATLVRDPRTAALEIGATARDGRVELQGPYLVPEDLSTVLQIANAFPGVREVRYSEGYSPEFEWAQQEAS
jgi:hypothetical protein